MNKQITNWGKFPVINVEEQKFSQKEELDRIVKNNNHFIARGLGRCYGDASLGQEVISTLKFDKVLYFDAINGEITCEAGVSFADILEFIVPKGWFLPVTPGTKFITVGGAVASDVHGKNHHLDGSFSYHINELSIYLADGSIVTCGPNNNKDLFQATCGGMGLTGIILTVKFKLKKIETAYISQKQIKAKNLEEIIELFQQYKGYTYSMAWIDCLKRGKQFGRSIMMAGEHSTIEEVKKDDPLKFPNKPKLIVPFNFPGFVLNSFSVKAFNFLYYHKNLKRQIENIIPYDPFFYPLDAILEWNRMYGKKGFVQYQFVLPLESSHQGLIDILNRISKKGMGSFLAVLKLFGKQDSIISFPMEGFTLALDFPIKKGLFEFLDELDKIVLSYGGRVYLTKDARMKHNIFWETYPNINRFVEIVNKYNPEFRFSSIQSDRLLAPYLKNRVETATKLTSSN
ncbi:FAD-binding oxidoreductase [Chondrinema litorale]|uniref:FAD-binding oxidoreductase n=1 Tax=Chondrinema litorale TaxID=2994555 RepID=UPI002543C2AC|nr:FAD-binding oxidoreductase [Chondrinema litorale]UZS00134.1 FAD-binding oxidoreductase [Chondrinema litorale]